MPEGQFQLALIVGSVREGRFAPVIANWFLGQVERRGDVVVDVIDLADLTDHGMPRDGGGFTERIGAADAYVVIVPEYNHGYPGPLKTAIDTVRVEWRAKPVGFVTYGGVSGGLRAAEQLRQVFAELHAVTVRETVSFHQARTRFDSEGEPVEPGAVELAAKVLLDQLAWWAFTLRAGRDARPYGG
ncbi:NADPH-dependent FMN reductase [Actinopolymorpha singaporensis]|uniref:NAD(P)H-dependent FMN reductase n=1 Tax=Actinopolymorpha singaporensis TaxID=117157 RepID=A0A1H1MAT8_9ACTN|nr:NAD(P)H-dependent oxidoreductase [Actinopolymorpha singaporensis]SDR83856.1 NAD(P)H-dependent FMN reductase [Actinopolymorpha singaporensis]